MFNCCLRVQLTLGMAIEAMGHDPHPRCVHQRGDGDLTAALAYEATLQWAVEANDVFVAGRAHASLARYDHSIVCSILATPDDAMIVKCTGACIVALIYCVVDGCFSDPITRVVGWFSQLNMHGRLPSSVKPVPISWVK